MRSAHAPFKNKKNLLMLLTRVTLTAGIFGFKLFGMKTKLMYDDDLSS